MPAFLVHIMSAALTYQELCTYLDALTLCVLDVTIVLSYQVSYTGCTNNMICYCTCYSIYDVAYGQGGPTLCTVSLWFSVVYSDSDSEHG